MSTVLDRPPATASLTEPPRGSRLPLLALLLVVLGVLGSVVVVAPRSVSFGSTSPRVNGAAVVTVPEYGVQGATIVGYEHRTSVRIDLPVRNRGRLPVTVTSVSLGGGPAPLLAVRDVGGLPITLWPGRSGTVTVTADLINCRYFHEREQQTYSGATFAGSVLGRDFESRVRFDRPVLVRSPMIVGCPDRKLNRQADDRTGLL